MRTIAIIGAGRLGASLAKALSESGLGPAAIADLSPAAARRAGRFVPGCLTTADNSEAARLGQAVFLCVPDSAIGPAARRLAGSGVDWRGKVVVHCSGLLDSRVLAPLRRRGARTASCHPARAFAGRPIRPGVLRGVAVAVEGQAAAWAARTFARMGAKPFRLAPGRKPLYHAACALASNDLVILLDTALSLLQASGFSRKRAWAIIGPLAQGTLHNVNKLGTPAALTGPLVRGDAAVVGRHLAALREFPPARKAYRALGLAAADLLKRSGVEPGRIKALMRLLEGR